MHIKPRGAASLAVGYVLVGSSARFASVTIGSVRCFNRTAQNIPASGRGIMCLYATNVNVYVFFRKATPSLYKK